MDKMMVMKLLGSTIYHRAVNYYNKGYVESIDIKDNTIFAEVLGSEDYPYEVIISMDKDDKPHRMSCDCPYYDYCKHIGAVLLHLINNPVEEPTSLTNPDELPENVEVTLEYGKPNEDAIPELLHLPPKIAHHPAPGSYRVAFLLNKVMTDYSHHYEKQWNISLKQQYIKKDGNPGALSSYNLTNKAPASTAEEIIFLEILSKRNPPRAQIEEFLHFIIRQQKKLNLHIYDHNTDTGSFLTIKKLTSITLEMSVSSLPKPDQPKLTPVIICNSFKNKSGQIQHSSDIIASADGIYIIDKLSGILYHKHGHIEASIFLTKLLSKSNYTKEEAASLFKYAERFKPLIITTPLLERIRIKYQTPNPIIYIEKRFSGIDATLFFQYEKTLVTPSAKSQFKDLPGKGNELHLAGRDQKTEHHYLQLFEKTFEDDKDAPFYTKYGNTKGQRHINYPMRDFLLTFGEELTENGFLISLDRDANSLINQKADIRFKIKTGIDWLDVHAETKEKDGTINPIQLNHKLLRDGLAKINGKYRLLSKEMLQYLGVLADAESQANGSLRISKFQPHLIDQLYNLIEEKSPELKSIHELSQRLLGMLKIKKTPVPVSTLFNWAAEIEHFAPKTPYIIHRGPERAADIVTLNIGHIILTSYHTLRNDIELFSEIQFFLIVLDEAQAIKNATTKIFKAIKCLQSKRRLTLTGTPIENSSLELWSQMHFLNPGLLGTKESFRKEFLNPIEKKQDKDAAERLRKLVYPFILRRKKEEVAKDLPEKEEILLYTEMGSKQRQIYDSVKQHYRKLIITSLNKKETRFNSLALVIEGMLRLRQICLFPGLADKKWDGIDSCKLERLSNLLQEIAEEGHKSLVFSQFTQALTRIRKGLPFKPDNFSYLDGKTRDRKAEVNSFQNNQDKKLFLISLKAGGTGINLTAAEYVFIFDPWWNPAVEAQAIDRAHRIGQENKVFAYKLIVKDTIEEKIIELQKTKKNLADTLISGEKGFLKKLSESDIKELFG